MQPRILTSAEVNTILASLALQTAHVQDGMASAADDRDMTRLRALLADNDMCDTLIRSLRAGHFRIMTG